MAERERERKREGSVDDVDVGSDIDLGEGAVDDIDVTDDRLEETARSRESTGGLGLGSRVREGAQTVATGRSLVIALALVTAGWLLLGGILPLGSIGNLLGIAAGTFLYGLGSDTRHFTETTVAGVLAGGVSVLLGNLALSATGAGVPLAAVGAVGGGLAGLVGHYLGRDLRDGLTRDV